MLWILVLVLLLYCVILLVCCILGRLWLVGICGYRFCVYILLECCGFCWVSGCFNWLGLVVLDVGCGLFWWGGICSVVVVFGKVFFLVCLFLLVGLGGWLVFGGWFWGWFGIYWSGVCWESSCVGLVVFSDCWGLLGCVLLNRVFCWFFVILWGFFGKIFVYFRGLFWSLISFKLEFSIWLKRLWIWCVFVRIG